MDHTFEALGLSHEYRSGTKALSNINLSINKGRKTAIMGANGAGKSTLFYHFNGVLKPSSGEVHYNGKTLDYSKESLYALRSDVSVVLQNPDEQIFSATVEEDVAFGMINCGMPADVIDRRIDEVLSMVGMSGYRMRPTRQLSFGQRKRVAFAGAIATNPKVLIMDEPTAGLDPQMATEILEFVDQLHCGGTDVIMSTHDVDLAYSWADEICVIRNGTSVYSGRPEGFYSDPVAVSMSGLMQPSMFAINRNLSEIYGRGPEPYPHTRAELLGKMCQHGKIGKLYTVPVDGKLSANIFESINVEHAVSGVIGVKARAAAFGAGMKLDYVFNSIDNCIIEAMNGRDAVILHDRDLSAALSERLERMKCFGVHVASERREPA